MPTADVIYSQFDWEKLSRKEQLSLADDYYDNNSLYEATRILKYYLGVWSEDIRPLRTPVHRSVEFFASKIAIGEPVISSKNKPIVDVVSQVMEWSNLQIQKPLQVRTMSKYGDLFRKVVSSDGKVWHEQIDSKDVTEFTEDVRGFLTSIRIDTTIDVDGVDKTRTEYWTVNDVLPYMAIWEHLLDENTPLDQLGDPIIYKPLSKFGIDFIPFTRTAFANTGGTWGASCFQHALLKVDEANRQSTRLHQMLYRYNKPTWLVSANQVAADGSPVAPPKLKQGTNADKTDLELRDNSILYLPGMSKVDSLIPDIDYKAALEILQSQEKELIQDLPELLYYSLPERADMSGKAIRNLLGAAIDRRTLAENSYVESTVRLNQMAITIGQFQGIFDAGLGTFDGGQLAHSIRYGDPFPTDISEKATTLQTLMSALGTDNAKLAMQLAGFSEEEISKYVKPEPVVPNSTPPQE